MAGAVGGCVGLGRPTKDINSHQTDLFFDEWIKLLQHDQPLYAGRKVMHQPARQRISHAQMEHRGVGEDLSGVLVGDAGRDDPQRAVAPFDAVGLGAVGELGQFVDAVLDHGMALPRVGRDHDILGRIARVSLDGRRHTHAIAQFDRSAGVANASGQPQHHRRVELFAQLERRHGQVLGLLAVARLQAGDASKPREGAVVLLVLRAVHAGVVG